MELLLWQQLFRGVREHSATIPTCWGGLRPLDFLTQGKNGTFSPIGMVQCCCRAPNIEIGPLGVPKIESRVKIGSRKVVSDFYLLQIWSYSRSFDYLKLG